MNFLYFLNKAIQNCYCCNIDGLCSNDECQACNLGHFNDEIGQEKCKECPIGKFSKLIFHYMK